MALWLGLSLVSDFRPLPLHPWIHARHSLASIYILPGDCQMPHRLRGAILGNLIDVPTLLLAGSADSQNSTFPFFRTALFPPKNEYVGAVEWKVSEAVFAVSSMSRSGTVL